MRGDPYHTCSMRGVTGMHAHSLGPSRGQGGRGGGGVHAHSLGPSRGQGGRGGGGACSLTGAQQGAGGGGGGGGGGGACSLTGAQQGAGRQGGRGGGVHAHSLGPSREAATMTKSNTFQPTLQKPKKLWYHLMRISITNSVRNTLSRPRNTGL